MQALLLCFTFFARSVFNFLHNTIEEHVLKLAIVVVKNPSFPVSLSFSSLAQAVPSLACKLLPSQLSSRSPHA